MQFDHGVFQTVHRLLRQLNDLQDQIRRCPKVEKAAETNLAGAESKLAENRQAWTQTKKLADEKQLQLRQREARIATLLGRRNAADNNRDFQLLSDQMAADKQANAVLSDEILELLERVDVLDGESKAHKAGVEAAKQQLEGVRADVQRRIRNLQAEIERVQRELGREEQRLPSDALTEYKRLVPKQGEQALAGTDGEACGNCHQMFTTNTLSKLRQNKLVICQSCNAILYFSERAAAGQRAGD